MKPNFALNLTETSIALLHRTAKGWTLVGETPFDAPDLPEALDYLRKTALGLEPGGITTKVVIPNSQILYAEVEAPGPSEDDRRAQIVQVLEQRTPYKASEVAYDFSGRGKVVRVAAVARETLAEAESFATEHRFNPVSFVAIPEGGYSGEPWFGPSQAAAGLIQTGDLVERDRQPVSLPVGGAAAGGDAAEADKAEPAPAPPPRIPPMAAPMSAPMSAPLPAPEAAPAEPAEKPPAPPTASAPATAPVSAAVTAPVADAPARPEMPRPAAPSATPAVSAPPPLGHAVAPQAPAPAQAVEAAQEPALSKAPAKTDDPAEAPFAHIPDADAAPVFAPVARVTSVSAAAPSRMPLPIDDDDDLPPMPAGLAGRAAAPAPRPVAGTVVTGPVPGAVLDDDDLPPAPAASILAARRAGSQAGALPTTTPATRPDAAALARAARGKPIEDLPPVPRPAQAAPIAGSGRAPAAARGLGGLVSAPSLGGSRKVKVKSPSPQAQIAARAAAAAPAAGTSAAGATAADAARSLSKLPFGQPQRGKPRHLGLILTAILLLCLALVAAWSSIYLSSVEPADDTVVAATDATAPAVEDEMLADAQDPEELADLAAAGDAGGAMLAEPGADAGAVDLTEAIPDAIPDAATEEAAIEPDSEPDAELAGEAPADPAPTDVAEAAPETGLAEGAPVAVALVDGQDEIFLAASEAPPPAFDALALPEPDPARDALPEVPMPPPAPGTVYRFDADGLIVPTPEGIPSPAGFMIFEGKPDVLPPPRSAVAEAAAAAAAVAAMAEAAPADASAGAAGAALPGQDASLVAALPVGTDPAATDPAAALAGAGPEAQPNPDLADRRPRERPADLVPPATAEDDASLAGSAATDFAVSLRPRERPATVLAAGERARLETAGASLASPGDAPADAAALVEPAALDAATAANPSLLLISRRPAEKPADFSRAVEAAVAAAVRAPDPAPEAEPAPQKTAAAPPPAEDVRPEEDESDEPEVVAAAPKIPTKASVAKTATFNSALNLSKTNLIGVYGTQSKRYALVRLSSGRYKKVSIGDRIDGGTIQAITQTEVRYQKGGRLVTLGLPKG